MLISNKYEVESLLGNGSMGEVYKAHHVNSGTLYALKVLPSRLMDHPDLLKGFYSQARVIAKLNHPNIVRVIDIDHDDELKLHYVVMEYIHGRTLSDYLEEKRGLSLKEICLIARQIGNALQFAHRNDPPLIHRDVKPCNIMLEDDSHRAVLMDFGIAKGLDEVNKTRSEMTAGTLRYCPREQLLYEPLDVSADIYALGMILYEAYTGSHFFAGLNEKQIVSSILSGQENAPVFNEGTPAEFKSLITKAIAKDRADRYHEMSEFLADLEDCWLKHDGKKESKKSSEIHPDSIQDPDERNQALERKNQRHVVLTDQTESRKAKEKAAQQDAVIGFQEQAEQIRQKMDALKTEADGCNAKETARTFYERALHFQSQGEECLKKSSYQEACKQFSEAFRIYQDAREFAYYKSLKDDTEVLSKRVKEAYDEAVKADANESAPTHFRKAIEIEQKAKAAFSSEDFAQANRLFRDAIENYALARQQVTGQQKQLEMLKARKQVLKLWHRARKAGAEQLFSAEFAEALALKEQGQYWEDQKKPEEAADHYNKAAAAFEQLQNETESLATQDQVKIFKQQLANDMAGFQSLRSWAREAWAEADAQLEKADAAWHDKHYPQARKLYSRAQEAYSQAQQQSIAEQCTEPAQRLQAGVQASRRVADHCEVEHYYPAHYQNAIEAQAKGADSLKNRKFQDAMEHFNKARESFEQAVLERHQQLKLEITSLQQQARECRAQDHASTLYHKGLESLSKAEELWEQSLQDRSYDSYCESYQLFKEACENTKLRMEKEENENVQMQALSKTRYRPSWNAAESIKNDTEKASRVDQLDQTVDLYEEAFNAFDRSDAEVEHQLAEPKRANNEDKTVVVNRYSGKEQQVLSHHRGIKRRAASALLIILIVMAGFIFFDFASIKQVFVATAPQAGLSIKKIMPSEEALSLEGGQSQAFAVEVSDKQKNRLDYTWYLDGKEQEKGDQWNYTPVFNDPEAASKEVKVVITDRKEYSLEKIWKVKIVPPAVNHAPRIVNKEPSEQNISLTKKETIVFSAEVSDEDPDDRVTFSWTLDGQEVSRSMAWIYEPKQEGRHEVALTVTDKAGLQDEYTWNITENMPVNNHPPRIVKAEPSEQKIELDAGAVINFSAEATDDDSKGALVYTWFADRHKQSSSNSWRYTVPSEGRHKISLQVADQDGMHTYRTWYITAKEPSSACVNVNKTDELCLPDSDIAIETGVHDKPTGGTNTTEVKTNHAPGINKASPPGQNLDLFLGKPAYFSVEAFDSDPGDQLTYSWSLDGEEQSTNNTWPYTPETLGRHKVTLRVSDQAGKQVQRIWLVNAVSPPAKCVTLDDSSELCLPDPNAVIQEDSKALPMPPRIASVSAENHPPHIFRAHPFEQRVELLIGNQIIFSAEAGDPDPDDLLAYAWSLDGQPMSTHSTWLYRPSIAGQHRIALSVTDTAGMTVQRIWHVNARAPAASCITLEDNSELCMPVQ